jgi:hypothetical protein
MNEMKALENRRRTNTSGRARLIGILIAALVMMLFAVAHVRAAVNSKPQTPHFNSPLNGWTVEGTVPVTVFAPELALFNAEFGVDNGSWQPMQSKGDGVFELKWNTAYVSNGKHTLTTRFYLELGGPPEVAVSIQVYVRNIRIPPLPDGQAGMLPLPCIHVIPPYGLEPSACAAPPAG